MNDPDATSSTDENIERVRALILNNGRVTTNEEAHYMDISHGYFHGIIHKGLGFHSVSARWVSKQLTEQQKRTVLHSAEVYWITFTTNWRLSETYLSVWTIRDSTITSQRVKTRMWNGNVRHC
jgi:hypothetical protein